MARKVMWTESAWRDLEEVADYFEKDSHHYAAAFVHNVTEHPTARWTAQQIVEAFPEDSAPRYLLRDRDGIYGELFHGRVKNMNIKEVLISPSGFQRPATYYPILNFQE